VERIVGHLAGVAGDTGDGGRMRIVEEEHACGTGRMCQRWVLFRPGAVAYVVQT
jgi:hypothetical protein